MASFFSLEIKVSVQKKYEIQQIIKKAWYYIQQWVHKIERFHDFFLCAMPSKERHLGKMTAAVGRRRHYSQVFMKKMFRNEKGGKE